MNELLKNDITVRTISLLFAILLWFFVLDNSANPFATTYLTIPLKIENENSLDARGMSLKDKNYQRTIVITVKGRKNAINNIRPDDFEAILDFSKVKEPGEKEIPIDGPYTKVNGVTIEDVRSKVVNVSVEKVIKSNFKVEVVTEGTLKQNYKIIKLSVAPESLSIQGIESSVKSVATVKTWIDVNNLDRDLAGKRECKVYDKQGAEIPELSKNLNVDVKVEVAKEVSVVPVVRGIPAKNHIEGSSRITPEKVLITGSPDVLSQISELRTEAIDITNASESMDVRKPIQLPEGSKLYNSPLEASVNISILKPVKKEFVINKENISIINSDTGNVYKYDIVSKSITVSLSGTQTDVDRLDIASFKPSVDVAKLTEGNYKLPLSLTLPQNVTLLDEYKVDVKIEKEQKPEQKPDPKPETKSEKETKVEKN